MFFGYNPLPPRWIAFSSRWVYEGRIYEAKDKLMSKCFPAIIRCPHSGALFLAGGYMRSHHNTQVGSIASLGVVSSASADDFYVDCYTPFCRWLCLCHG